MLIGTKVVRSTSELLKELLGFSVTKALIYPNVDNGKPSTIDRPEIVLFLFSVAAHYLIKLLIVAVDMY